MPDTPPNRSLFAAGIKTASITASIRLGRQRGRPVLSLAARPNSALSETPLKGCRTRGDAITDNVTTVPWRWGHDIS